MSVRRGRRQLGGRDRIPLIVSVSALAMVSRWATMGREKLNEMMDSANRIAAPLPRGAGDSR